MKKMNKWKKKKKLRDENKQDENKMKTEWKQKQNEQNKKWKNKTNITKENKQKVKLKEEYFNSRSPYIWTVASVTRMVNSLG